MKKIKLLILSLMAIASLATISAVPAVVHAADDPIKSAGQGVEDIGGKPANDADFKAGLKNIINVMLFVLGAIAVIMIIVGGIRYTTSGGDAGSTKAARETILYAVIGVIVALLAFAIVNFAISAFKAT